MELRHCRYVVAVADSLHFGQAAERLHISQPPLSQQIRQLEDELGVRLFHRTRRHVALTDAGRVFVREARLILAQAERTARLAARMGEGDGHRLTIGVTDAARTPSVVEALRCFAMRHPRVRVAARTMTAAEQVQALREGRLDAGFLDGDVEAPSLAVEPFARRQMLLALPQAHRLAARGHLSLRAVAAEAHVMVARERDPRLYDAIMLACQDAGFQPPVVHEADDVTTVHTLVAAGFGVGLVPAGLGPATDLVLRRLQPQPPGLGGPLVLAYDPEARGPSADFVSVARGVAARHLRPSSSGRRRVS